MSHQSTTILEATRPCHKNRETKYFLPQNIWLSVNSDLEYAKSSLQELFYLLPLNTNEEVKAVMEVAEVIQNIPGKVEALYREAAEDGRQDSYVSSSSWPSRQQKTGEERK